MTSYMLAACVVFGLVAIGEVISYLTKAVVPSMAGALILYLILIWEIWLCICFVLELEQALHQQSM